MNPTSKKFIALLLAISLMTINCASIRTTGGKKEKHGAKLIITKTDEQQIKGELITVKPNSLLLLDTEGKDVSVDIADIKVIVIVKKSKFWAGAGIGFLTGVVLGAIVSIPAVDAASDPSSYYYFVPWVLTVIYGAIGGLACGIIGGIVGAGYGTDKTILLEGMSDSEIKKAMDKLRKKARIRDYK